MLPPTDLLLPDDHKDLPVCHPFATFDDLLDAKMLELAICRGMCDDASFIKKGWIQTNRHNIRRLSEDSDRGGFFRIILVMADLQQNEAAKMWEDYITSNSGTPYRLLVGLIMSAWAHRESGADHTAVRLIQQAWDVCAKQYAWVEVHVAKIMGGTSKFKDECLNYYKSFLDKLELHMDTSGTADVIGVHAYYEYAMQVYVCSFDQKALQGSQLKAAERRKLQRMVVEMKILKEKGDCLRSKASLGRACCYNRAASDRNYFPALHYLEVNLANFQQILPEINFESLSASQNKLHGGRAKAAPSAQASKHDVLTASRSMKDLGDKYMRKSDYKNALEQYTPALARLKGCSGEASAEFFYQLHLSTAECYLNLEDPQQAMHASGKALNFDNKSEAALFIHAKACSKLQKTEEAISTMHKLLENVPKKKKKIHYEYKEFLAKLEGESVGRGKLDTCITHVENEPDDGKTRNDNEHDVHILSPDTIPHREEIADILKDVALGVAQDEERRQKNRALREELLAHKQGETPMLLNTFTRLSNEQYAQMERESEELEQLTLRKQESFAKKEAELSELEKKWRSKIMEADAMKCETQTYVTTEVQKLEQSFSEKFKKLEEERIAEMEEMKRMYTLKEAQFDQKRKELESERRRSLQVMEEVFENANRSREAEETRRACEEAHLQAERKRLEAKSEEVHKERALYEQKAEDLQLQQDRLNKDMDHNSLLLAEIQKGKSDLEHLSSLPKHWKLTPNSDPGFDLVQIKCRETLLVLQSCLEIDVPLGQGKDYADKSCMPHDGIKLHSAWRVENIHLWQKYMAEHKKMRCDLSSAGLQVVKEHVKDALAGCAEGLPDTFAEDLNETMLLHGTTPDHCLPILKDGLNERYNMRAYFGHGSYLAEDMAKADQYVKIDKRYLCSPKLEDLHHLLYSNPRSHPQDIFYVLLCRVVLGYSVHSQNGETSMQGGHDVYANKARREFAAMPGQRMPYHSLIIEKSSPDPNFKSRGVLRFREFIFTHSDRIYPQYLLAVKRVKGRR